MTGKPHIAALLEAACRDFHAETRRRRDPISLVHAYTDPRDREVVAFLCSLLAYGNVATILNSARRVLGAIGERPFYDVLNDDYANFLPDFRHRFTTGQDLAILLTWTQEALRQSGSLEAFFVEERKRTMAEQLSSFVRRFTSLPLPESLQQIARKRERSLKYLLSDPMRGSSCKRLNMFLRWVIRPDDGIDLGLWKAVHPRELVLPIDTHLLKVLRGLGWTKSRQATWKVAETATAKLRLYDADDPTRFDFALCHLSMAGNSIRKYMKSRA